MITHYIIQSGLTIDLLNTLSDHICKYSNHDFENVLYTLKQKFQRGNNNIYDIYNLIEYLYNSKIYNFDKNIAITLINNILLNGSKYLFDDSIIFLEYLKNTGNNIYILSYNESELYYQTVKIAGSGLTKYINGIITTTKIKADMPLDFKNSIFIDDKPKDLIAIYKKNPLKIYRIRRINDTYSHLDTNLTIKEFSSLNDLKQHLEKI